MSLTNLLQEDSLWNLVIRFSFNLIILYIIVGLIYYRFSKKEEYLFSYTLIGVMIFLICSILGSVDLQIGLALGLFGIFAIIRFRTEAFSVKDISYVFIIIGVSIINSQANLNPPVAGALIINFSIILITLFLELFLLKNGMQKMTMNYSRTELLKPGRKAELLKELSFLTGQKIEKVTIEKVDFEKNRAELQVHFRQADPGNFQPSVQKADPVEFPSAPMQVSEKKQETSEARN